MRVRRAQILGFLVALVATSVFGAATPAQAELRILDTIPLGGMGGRLALTPSGAQAYVIRGSLGPGSPVSGVNVVDLAARAVTTFVPIGIMTVDVAMSADGSKAYVTNTGYTQDPGQLSVIDTATNSVTSGRAAKPDRRRYRRVGAAASSLDVLPRQVGHAGDGWLASECGVWPVMVVDV